MTDLRTCAELWSEAKGLLLPYEGSASQLYVLDLPSRSLAVALDKLSDGKANPQVITLDHYTADPVPFTRELQRTVLASSEESTYHVLEGDWLPCKGLRIWIWIDASAATYDLELVFWANLLFPHPEDEKACGEAFCEVVTLAEALRELNPESQCILSASETGDPREDIGTSWTLNW